LLIDRTSSSIYVRLRPDNLNETPRARPERSALGVEPHAGCCGAGGKNPPATRLCHWFIYWQYLLGMADSEN